MRPPGSQTLFGWQFMPLFSLLAPVRLNCYGHVCTNKEIQMKVGAGGETRIQGQDFAAAFKQHVVRQYHRRAAMLLEDGEDMLERIELLVAGARPEIVPVDDERFLGRLASLVDDGHAALLAKGWIGHHQVVMAEDVAVLPKLLNEGPISSRPPLISQLNGPLLNRVRLLPER